MLDVLANAIYPTVLAHWFITDLTRRVPETARALFDFCSSPLCSTTATKRVNALLKITSCVIPLRQWPGFSGPVAALPYRLLQKRLDGGPRPGWSIVDGPLITLLSSDTDSRPSRADVLASIKAWRTQQWGEEESTIRPLMLTYLRRTLAHTNRDDLLMIRDEMSNIDLFQDNAVFLVELEDRLEKLSETSLCPEKLSTGHLFSKPSRWKRCVREAVEEIVTPESVSWMEDDDESNEQEFATRALGEIQDRFERPLSLSTTIARVELIDKLAELPCILANCDGSECLAIANILPLSTIRPCFHLISRITEGNAEEVTDVVRRRLYSTLGRIIKHHAVNRTEDGVDNAIQVILRGITDPERSVRSSAGRALTVLIQTYSSSNPEAWKQTEPIFAQLYRTMDTAKNYIRETLVIAVGLMGRITNVEVLGQVVCFLVAQLGRPNSAIKASAYIQILSVAKHHKKTPYALLLPFMDQIAPFLVCQMCIQPSLLSEACRLMSIAPGDFISITLPRTLPQVFAECKLPVLEAVSRELGANPPSLLLKHSPQVLAHVFLLPRANDTTKALNFIVKVLTDAARNADPSAMKEKRIDIQSLVKSCVVPLLAELVVAMGDEDLDVAERAVSALKKVERVQSTSPSQGRSLPETDLGIFLKGYMLGLISDINDMLQDVQGKKSVASKRKILRSLGALVTVLGSATITVAPQIMATFQTMVSIRELSEVTLDSWHKFLTIFGPNEVGPHVGPTTAALLSSWPDFSPVGRELATKCLEYIVIDLGSKLDQHLNDVVDPAEIEELRHIRKRLKELRGNRTPRDELQRILERSTSDNLTVAVQSLQELRSFMLIKHQEFIREIAFGDAFDPLVGRILASLFSAACRDGDGTEVHKPIAFECMSILGAVDPDRCEIGIEDFAMVVVRNFEDETESVDFAIHLIRDLLVGAFRSTSDIKYQSHLAFSIQELLQFCRFTPGLVSARHGSVPVKVRNRWNALPKHVLETITPLLEARFKLNEREPPKLELPIYPYQSTYREWIQLWTTHLISRASGDQARTIFKVFRSAVRNKDVVVAHHLLPHLVLNILISGAEEDKDTIRSELIAILEDQINPHSDSSADKKLLSAQAVFMLLDHVNKWLYIKRLEITKETAKLKANRRRGQAKYVPSALELLVTKIESTLSAIDQNLMARAAFQCKAYARALVNFEGCIRTLQQRSSSHPDLPDYYEKLHEIYAHLDEPDGMEGISTLILSPSLEHQIRQHESTGRWTAAQSCWEVRLQQSPDNVEFHLGLLRCLRNLGHYDTLRTHVRGVLTRNPEWEMALAEFQVESAWMVGAWDDVNALVQRTNAQTPSMAIARVLLAMRSEDDTAVSASTSAARALLGAPIAAAGVRGYRRAYDDVLNLHLTYELEIIYKAITSLPVQSQGSTQRRRRVLSELSQILSARLDSTLPTFRYREPILSTRRTAFSLLSTNRPLLLNEIGRSWLASAKIARKAGQWQTAYSALLQAQQSKARYCFLESAKLVKVSDDPLRALQDLENSMKFLNLFTMDDDELDLTIDEETTKMRAKGHLLRARWMKESDRFDGKIVFNAFQQAADLIANWESAQFHLGQYEDGCYRALVAKDERHRTKHLGMNLCTIRTYAKSIQAGSKYVYQTVPRLLTLWLDLGEEKDMSGNEVYRKITHTVTGAFGTCPVYKWYTAFPQIVSRVGHTNAQVYEGLSKLITNVLMEYPKQALWLFVSVVQSTKSARQQRGRQILNQLKSNPRLARTQVPKLVLQSEAMTNALLALCDAPVDDRSTLSMKHEFPSLSKMVNSDLIIPLQESLTATLPPTSADESTHQPFPPNPPTFHEFFDEINVMTSLARPRKITIRGSDGNVYMFLGKPKDDLRKDARLMDFNSIINKLLKASSESRKRHLRIRTYGVVTLNEECGFIQWVPNTIPLRPILVDLYNERGTKSWNSDLGAVFAEIKQVQTLDGQGIKDWWQKRYAAEEVAKAGGKWKGKTGKEREREKKEEQSLPPAVVIYRDLVVPQFPGVFHKWFLETFPEPTAWLASRLSYVRTAAVMSMVGFILGLGDRHCENILLDTSTGDVVHVDFNCLFEKGKKLETPERVPLRLTTNIIDGFGVTGVEGPFRIACEVTMKLLREHKDSLMSVLDAFIHDPLVEWEDDRRKALRMQEQQKRMHKNGRDNDPRNDMNIVKQTTDLRKLAKNALSPIELKLNGIYGEKQMKAISVSNMVQLLIQESTDQHNLARMYPGWAPWH
ncbi:hypothetical protein BDQ12DRAFT_199518 [Crucibulum laeve]|uniref:non-specific serine/threonine protein kinase n=1 Tax=Crucibulum laeve TaxID=68775 RepID=A0A5C3MGV0_9AGAR|nr:hypothetical protein BDQ12DRAFT_199518 [Crucibulum laeve]